MFRSRSILLFLGSFALSAVLHAAELSVFAAASLQDALTQIGAGYEQESGDKVAFNFGGSSMLARQVEQGAPADVFFSADEAKVDGLEKKGLLLPDTRRSLLTNTLVVVVRADAATTPTVAADLAKAVFKRIALAEPATVPAGIYAQEYLEKLGLWRVLQAKVVPTENVRAALAAVESGNVEAGFVYKTDALISKTVKVAVEVPAAEGPRISYPLAVVKESKQPEKAKNFAAYLSGPAARAVFEKFGFGILK